MRTAKQRLQTGRQSSSTFDNMFPTTSSEQQHPKACISFLNSVSVFDFVAEIYMLQCRKQLIA
jgi:hypothetical protein